MTTAESKGKTYVRIEDEDGNHLRTMSYPEMISDPYHDAKWPVPQTNFFTGEVGVPESMYTGEVWFDSKGNIQVTSVSWTIRNPGDARRIAVALLAAADEKDRRDHPFVPGEVKY